MRISLKYFGQGDHLYLYLQIINADIYSGVSLSNILKVGVKTIPTLNAYFVAAV